MTSSTIYSFDSWNATLWDKIDVEFLMDETKKLNKEIKQLHKGCRAYDLFKAGAYTRSLFSST